ncbi:MAG: DNA-directed RNA polymerase subunit P [Candidatus Aenigmatarchaeota archaeon]
MYKCLQCGKTVDFETLKEKIRCPYCGYRILLKSRPKTTRKVSAI